MKDYPDFEFDATAAERIVDALMSNPVQAKAIQSHLTHRLSDRLSTPVDDTAVDADLDDLWDNVPI